MLWLLAVRGGGGRLLVRIFRIIFVRGLFHTFGFAGGIAILVVIAGAIYLYYRRRRGPWRRRRRW